MRRVLVTGASGLVGRQVLAELEAVGEEVHGVARLPSDHVRAVDLLDRDAVEALLADVRPTHVLHLAWTTEHKRFWRAPENLDWVAASAHLLRAAARHGCHRFVAAGSCAEYALGDWTCVEGETPLEPATLYGAAKDAFRRLAVAAGPELDVEVAWGRVFFLHGPGEHPDRLVPSVIRSLLAGEEARCTPGTQVRDFLHSSDVAAAFVQLLSTDLVGAVNVASGEGVRIAEVVERLGTIVGRPDLVRLGALPLPVGDARIVTGDATRLRASGWSPRLSLDEGLERTVDWWRAA